MPFKKVGENKYKGPTGKMFTEAQVRLYYANGGKFPAHGSKPPVRHQGKSRGKG